MRDDEQLRPWFESAIEQVPGVEIYDVHMHVGQNDPDGFKADTADIEATLDAAGARGVIFPFNEPDGYPPANDGVIAGAAASDGKLVAFCRLDPTKGEAVAEAERSLDAGARGIKLHPRAEGFTMHDPEVRRVFEVADERHVPVIIHAGRGIPALGRNTADLAEEFPRASVILAHCGISDLSWIWRRAAQLPNLYFDTSWWSPADVMALCALVPPGQVLFASDTPYGTPLQHSLFVIRCALQAGLSQEQVRGLMGGQTARLVEAGEPLDLGPSPGRRELPSDVLLMRVNTFLHTAVGRIFAGADGEETIALARLACYTGEEEPRRDVFASILRLLDLAQERLPAAPVGPSSNGVHLLMTAICLSATPDVPVPAGYAG